MYNSLISVFGKGKAQLLLLLGLLVMAMSLHRMPEKEQMPETTTSASTTMEVKQSTINDVEARRAQIMSEAAMLLEQRGHVKQQRSHVNLQQDFRDTGDSIAGEGDFAAGRNSRGKVSIAAAINQGGVHTAEAQPAEQAWRQMIASKNYDNVPTVEVVATGYTAGKESTGKTPGHPEYGITFSGVKVRRGVVSTIAADPKVFPIGTVLDIPGYGIGVVADTGSAIKGHKIDLYYETTDEVYSNWGKKKVKVWVLKQGEGKVTEAMLDEISEMIEI